MSAPIKGNDRDRKHATRPVGVEVAGPAAENPGPGRSGPALLLFAEHYPGRDAVALERLGLSPRQAEVLLRIVRELR